MDIFVLRNLRHTRETIELVTPYFGCYSTAWLNVPSPTGKCDRDIVYRFLYNLMPKIVRTFKLFSKPTIRRL